MTIFVSEEFEDGPAIEAALLKAESALQSGDAATPEQGTKADSAIQPATLIALGNATNITVAPTDTLDRVYTANLTGNGTLTVTSGGAGKYADLMTCLSYSTVAGPVGWGAAAWNIGVLAGLGPIGVVPAVAIGAASYARDEPLWRCLPDDLGR